MQEYRNISIYLSIKEMKQLRVDKANAELAKDKVEAKMQELSI